MLLSGLAMTVALGCVGRGANEPSKTVAIAAPDSTSGTDPSGLSGGIWLYGVPIAGSGHAYHAIPSPTALVAEPAPVATADVRLRQPNVSVPEPAPARGDVGDWRVLLERYDWPIGEAVKIVLCESSGNPNARNGTSIGLFEINTAAHPYTVSQMLDPVQNVAAAYKIWADSGWGPWSCKPY